MFMYRMTFLVCVQTDRHTHFLQHCSVLIKRLSQLLKQINTESLLWSLNSSLCLRVNTMKLQRPTHHKTKPAALCRSPSLCVSYLLCVCVHLPHIFNLLNICPPQDVCVCVCSTYTAHWEVAPGHFSTDRNKKKILLSVRLVSGRFDPGGGGCPVLPS